MRPSVSQGGFFLQRRVALASPKELGWFPGSGSLGKLKEVKPHTQSEALIALSIS